MKVSKNFSNNQSGNSISEGTKVINWETLDAKKHKRQVAIFDSGSKVMVIQRTSKRLLHKKIAMAKTKGLAVYATAGRLK